MTAAPGRRYLWVFSAADEWTVRWHARLLERRRAAGFDVEGFCNTPISLQRRWLPFPELDRRWRTGDRALMEMYGELAAKLVGRDVLVLYNGANLHPEFVRPLDLLKVYTAGDDPESTEILTKPVAPAFDVHLVNNIACLDMYRSWGLANVHFWPLGSLSTVDDVADLDEPGILDPGRRPVPIVFLGGYDRRRKDRLDAVSGAFPDAHCAGKGWPRGVVSWDEMWALYRRSRIGWNFHNSSGPINFRTYELPAYGVLQICDNRSHLGKIFELGREVAGFETTEECIDVTRYYLAHTEEQRAVAAAGWRRWKKDYHPDRVWERLVEIVDRCGRPAGAAGARPASPPEPGAMRGNGPAAPGGGAAPDHGDLAGRDYWDGRYGAPPQQVAGGWSPATYDALALERILLASIDRCRPETVLEVGCGNSVWLPYLAKKRGVAVSGMDYSEPGCALARARLAAEGVPGAIRCLDLFRANPDEVGLYDFVYSLGLAEHFPDLEDVLAHLLGFVKRGGTLLTAVPNLVSIHGALSWAYQPAQLAKHSPVTRARLGQACRNAGLQGVEAAYAGLFSFNIVAWGVNPRWPRVDPHLLPVVRKAVRVVDRLARRLGSFRGVAAFAPFLYATGTKAR